MKRIMNLADRHARALGLLLAAVLAALTAALNVSRGPLSNLNDIGGWTNRMAFIALAAAAHAAVLAMQIIRYHFTPFFQTFYHPMTCKKKGDSFGDVEISN